MWGAPQRLRGGMQIFVKLPIGVTITLDVETWDTIDFVKAKIQDRTLVAKERQILRFEGKAAAGGSIAKQLADDLSLFYYCMPHSGRTLHLEVPSWSDAAEQQQHKLRIYFG